MANRDEIATEANKYRKTVETDSLGLTLTTEIGFDKDGQYHHDYTYRHGDREVRIHATRGGRPLPSSWHTRQTAYADYYERGQHVGRTRAYNHLDNAQIKAVRYVMGLESDDKAKEAHRANLVEKRQQNRAALLSVPEAERGWVEQLAREIGFDIRNNDDTEAVAAFIDAYAVTADCNGLFELLFRQQTLEHKMAGWMSENPGHDASDAPMWDEFRCLHRQIAPLRDECRAAASREARQEASHDVSLTGEAEASRDASGALANGPRTESSRSERAVR